MKITVQHEELASRLGAASRIAVGKGTNLALGGVQIHADADGVELRATNIEMGLRNPLIATVAAEGTVLLPAKLLQDVVKSMPKGEVTLEHQPATQDVLVSSGTSQFTLRTLRNEDFPTLATPEEDKSWSIAAEALAETVSQVSRSASRDESRPLLTGIMVSVSTTEGVLRMVATDSYRLAIKTTHLESTPEEDFSAVIPARTLEEVVKIATSEKADVIKVGSNKGQIVFVMGDTQLTSRLIDGKFPDYNQLVPKDFEHTLVFDRNELLQRVERISLLAQASTPIKFTLNDKGLKLSAQSVEVGEAVETVDVAWSSEELETGFNPQYLIEGLKSNPSKQVELKLINALKPGLLQSADESGFQYLIMPVRLGL